MAPGLGGGSAAREREVSAKELEVARLLAVLARLVWEADHGPPCTHTHRWGAKGRRSACADDDDDTPQPPRALPPAPPPPPPPRAASEKLTKKRIRAAAAQAPPRKDQRHGAGHGSATAAAAEKNLGEAGAAEAAAATGTSSPDTPLDFCPSAEEVDAMARARACPPAKKPKLKHEHLSKQVDQLNHTRTELQKEALEIRKRLESLRARNSELVDLRIKMEEGRKRPRERDCVDLLPADPGRPASAAHPLDRVHPQAQQQQQQSQQSWPQHWVNSHVVFRQVAPGFSIRPAAATATAVAGSQGWSWAGSQGWRSNGGDGAGKGEVVDLNSGAGLDSAQQQQQQQRHPQQQETNYQYQQRQEQKAARKKRIQMMQQRRNAAGAAPAGGASVKVAGFR